MQSYNIHPAKTHLSHLIELAVRGEPFVIAKAGKPLVTVTAVTQCAPVPLRRLGFLAGRFAVPEDFDTLGRQQIEGFFQGEP